MADRITLAISASLSMAKSALTRSERGIPEGDFKGIAVPLTGMSDDLPCISATLAFREGAVILQLLRYEGQIEVCVSQYAAVN